MTTNAEDWRKLGEKLLEEGNFWESINCYDKATNLEPNDYRAWVNKGIALAELNFYEEALNCLDKAVNLEPNNCKVWTNKGGVLAELGRYEEAVDCYTNSIKIQPDDYTAWSQKSHALYYLGRYDEAIKCCTKTIKIQPDDYTVWSTKGISLFQLERYEEAIDCYDQAIVFNPDDYQTHCLRGCALLRLGFYEEAIKSCDQAITLNPSDSQAWLTKGHASMHLKRYKAAINHYDHATALKPEYGEAWSNRAAALNELKRYEEAVLSAKEALKTNSEDAHAWNMKGFAFAQLESHEKAIDCYERAIKLKPDYYQALDKLGVILSNLERYKEAIGYFNKALALKSDYYEAWINKGNALSDLGHKEEAINSYDQALLIKLDIWQAWIDRGGCVDEFCNQNMVSPVLAAALQNLKLNKPDYLGKLANFKEGLRHIDQESEPEGWGQLHLQIGRAHYFHGRSQPKPRPYFRSAVRRYQIALQTLTETSFKEGYLEVVQDLIKACLGLGRIAEAVGLQQRAAEVLEALINETLSPGRKQQLKRKFVGVQQLAVTVLVKSNKEVEALEAAEREKNAFLTWLLDLWSEEVHEEINQFKYHHMRQLLERYPSTAIIYWHLSPAALTTFILRSDTPEPIVLSNVTKSDSTLDNSPLPGSWQQQREIENWIKQWNELYADYSITQGKKAKQSHGWRTCKMQEMLESLRDILHISKIERCVLNKEVGGSFEDSASDTSPSPVKINHLILIPHRDLHRLPLHTLFADELTVTYLPSSRVGLKLIPPVPIRDLLCVEPPISTDSNIPVEFSRLAFAALEALLIRQMFQTTLIPANLATQHELQTQLLGSHDAFHFTGHASSIPRDPKTSALFLKGGERLTVADICSECQLRGYSLACLSACETALTNNQNINIEYVGLVSGFLCGGANQIISTLWTVQSVSSTLLMLQFYDYLQKEFPAPLALKEAQRWLRDAECATLTECLEDWLARPLPDKPTIRSFLKTEIRRLQRTKQKHPFQHPYYWAAFTLTGLPSQP
jgi:tetratricopeptide (TPR) repeat protein